MDEGKDNAAPVILNASDLPSRRHEDLPQPREDGSTGLFDVYASPWSGARGGLDDMNSSSDDSDELEDIDELDEQEVFDLIKDISDPEHPLSLGSLGVVRLPDIHVLPPTNARSQISTVTVEITPTITHCSLATIIGLAVRVRLEQALPPRCRVDVRIKEGTHSTDTAVSKQLGDKERVAAALENATLMSTLRKMLETCR